MSLELAVSQVLMRARVLERALHDDGPWFIGLENENQTNKIMIRASRTVTGNAVTFSIPLAVNGVGNATATLLCGADVMLVRSVWLTGSAEVTHVDWELRLSDAVPA